MGVNLNEIFLKIHRRLCGGESSLIIKDETALYSESGD